jgi:peptidoglycan/LPS O-acetylase OafA/YrhL
MVVSVPGGSSREIRSLTVIRGVAAWWIVFHHLTPIVERLAPEVMILRLFINAGSVAIPMFFVLSGYVLALNYPAAQSASSILRFLGSRLARLYPVHAATLLVSVILVARNGWPTDAGHGTASFLANLMLTHAWKWNFSVTWNYPSWTASSQWFAYLVLPAVIALTRRLGTSAMSVALVLAWVATVALYFAGRQTPFWALLVVIPTFGGGVLLARLLPPRRDSGLAATVASIVPLAILGTALAAPLGQVRTALLIGLSFALVGSLGRTGLDEPSWARGRTLRFFGQFSYSLYLTHAITITLIARFVPLTDMPTLPLAMRITTIVLMLLAIFVCASASYFLIEQPVRAYTKVLTKRAHSNRTIHQTAPIATVTAVD